MAEAPRPEHWLVEVARRAGRLDPDAAPADRDAPLADAWVQVAAAATLSLGELAKLVAKHYRLDPAQLDGADDRATRLVPENLARRHVVFPLRETDRQLVVATSDPTDVRGEQDLSFASGRRVVFQVAPPGAILEAIDAHYAPEHLVEQLLDRVAGDTTSLVEFVEAAGPETVAQDEVGSAPVVKLTNVILAEAVEQGASDVHLEPGREGGTVRFRIDGVLRPFMQIPMYALNRVVSRIKIMGEMDIADRLRPQDGRARLAAGQRTLDLRISTVPTRDAEKAVIRLLDPNSTRRIEELHLPAPELARLRRLLGHRDGILLVTGPTGSGKTTLLYAALQELATGEVNIMTVEDPVEYELAGLTQIQVETKRGVTFASALRSVLRQDPDVVLVGEIRDLETAETAVQASLTGHLVLATLHANDAVGAIGRLVDLGVAPSRIAATMRGAVAQRLLRRVCADCAVPTEGRLTVDEEALATRYGVRPATRTVGCERCGNTGFRGRLPILEVLTSSPPIETLVTDGAPAADVHAAAIAAGLRPMLTVALELAAAGNTTLQEIERVLGELPPEDAAPSQTPLVLVVDDDPVIRRTASAVLKENGFRVAEASDGKAALKRLKNEATDCGLVVMDLDMPKLGGLETLKRLRAAVGTAALPVVILTGAEADETEVAALDAGADDYVRKPLDPARFVARVKAALRRAGT